MPGSPRAGFSRTHCSGRTSRLLNTGFRERVDQLADGRADGWMLGFETHRELLETFGERVIFVVQRRRTEQTCQVVEQQHERLARARVDRVPVEALEPGVQGKDVLLNVWAHLISPLRITPGRACRFYPL